MEILIVAFMVILLTTGTLLYSSLAWGLVGLKFYNWFLLPIFIDLPIINYWQAVGLMFFISLFRNHTNSSIKEEHKDKKLVWIQISLGPWITLFIGYLMYIIFII